MLWLIWKLLKRRKPKPVDELNYDRAVRRRLRMPEEVEELTKPLREQYKKYDALEEDAAKFETPWDVHTALYVPSAPVRVRAGRRGASRALPAASSSGRRWWRSRSSGSWSCATRTTCWAATTS